MPLPGWMSTHLPPKSPHPEWIRERLVAQPADDEPAGITPCTCRGEGCTNCDGDGVIYP